MKAVKTFFEDLINKNAVGKCGKSSDDFTAYKEFSPKKGISVENTVILLHGLMRAKETWDKCGQCIADRTNSKVYSLDARNHGDSKWVETMEYDSMVNDVAQFMDNMKIPKSVIVGYGMGAITGMILALKYPQRIQSLIVEDTSLSSHSKSREQLRFTTQKLRREVLEFVDPNIGLKEAQKMAVSCLVSRHYYYTIKRRQNKPVRWDGMDLPLKKKLSGRYKWKLNLKSIAENMDTGPWKQTGVFEGPVLVIYGTPSSNNVLEERVQFLKQFPRALYEPIQDGGGLLPLHIEYPGMFTDLVCDFLLKKRG